MRIPRDHAPPEEPEVLEAPTGVEPELVEEALEEAVKGLANLLSRLEKLRDVMEGLRGSGRVRRLGPGAQTCYLAVDSGFTSPPIEVLGGYLSLVQVATVPYGPACGGPPTKVLYVHFNPERDDTDAFARVKEREHALAGLRWLEGVEGPKALLIDGEVVPRFGARRRASGEGVVEEAIRKSRELIMEALGRGIPVIGVLKRSFSRDVAVAEGLGPDLTDRALMSALLGEGEYFVAGTYREIHASFSEKAPKDLRWRAEWLRWAASDDVFGDVVVAFYRPAHSLFPTATKVELAVPEGVGVGEVLSSLAAVSESTGLPAPIDYVDALSRIGPETVYTVYQLLLNRLSGLSKEAAEVLMAVVNPQKLGPLGFVT